jgi:hypothetical protein
MVRRLALLLLLLPALGGCGGAFMTSTPPYARFGADAVLKEFKAQGLRVDGAQPLPKGALGDGAPAYGEAKSFAAGKPGSSTKATLFTFDSPADLAAMQDFLHKKYPKSARLVPHRNVLLVFWVAGIEDTGGYDPVLFSLR